MSPKNFSRLLVYSSRPWAAMGCWSVGGSGIVLRVNSCLNSYGEAMMRVSFLFLVAMILSGFTQPGWTTSKAYMTNGETRLGYINILDGRVTIRGEDRLFQFAERAVHRIEHVTGDTSLVGTGDVFLREKPEKLSRNLIFVPKGCEVIIKSATGNWVKVEAYGGKRRTEGYVLAEELSDSVYLNPPLYPGIIFKDPPPNLKDRFLDKNKVIDRELLKQQFPAFFEKANETDFGLLSQRLYGTTPQGVIDQKKTAEDQKGTATKQDEDLVPRPVEPSSR